MKKIILSNEEYDVLQKLLRAVPVAQLTRLLPGCDGGDLHYYRGLLTKVLRENHYFPKTDDGMDWEKNMPYSHILEKVSAELSQCEGDPEWGMHPEGEFDPAIYSEPNNPEISEFDLEG